MKARALSVWTTANTANSARIPNSTPDMISWARTVSRAPPSTTSSMRMNQAAPTTVDNAVLSARLWSKRDSVIDPAGSDPATMKMVAETTRAQPLMKPRKGCRVRPTQE